MITRRRTIGGLGLVIAAVTLLFASSASANQIYFFKQSMEGHLVIHTGDWVSGGYQIHIPGTHPADTVALANAEVLLPISCTDGGSLNGFIHIPLKAGPYDIPQNDGDNFPGPNANQNDPVVWQGAVQAPALCGPGNPMYNQTNDPTYGNGAAFVADLQATQPDMVHVQFHYRDPAAKGLDNTNCSDPGSFDGSPTCSASWSADIAFHVDQTNTPVPVGTIGAIGLAVLLSAVLVAAQVRRRRGRVAQVEI